MTPGTLRSPWPVATNFKILLWCEGNMTKLMAVSQELQLALAFQTVRRAARCYKITAHSSDGGLPACAWGQHDQSNSWWPSPARVRGLMDTLPSLSPTRTLFLCHHNEPPQLCCSPHFDRCVLCQRSIILQSNKLKASYATTQLFVSVQATIYDCMSSCSQLSCTNVLHSTATVSL